MDLYPGYRRFSNAEMGLKIRPCMQKRMNALKNEKVLTGFDGSSLKMMLESLEKISTEDDAIVILYRNLHAKLS